MKIRYPIIGFVILTIVLVIFDDIGWSLLGWHLTTLALDITAILLFFDILFIIYLIIKKVWVTIQARKKP